MTILRSIIDAIWGRSVADEPEPAEHGLHEPVDVAAHLDMLAHNKPYQLDWKHSVVDLMKLLNLDSSFDHRRTLALELGYTGEVHDSADMNRWLHKQIMRKLADNGGNIPRELL